MEVHRLGDDSTVFGRLNLLHEWFEDVALDRRAGLRQIAVDDGARAGFGAGLLRHGCIAPQLRPRLG